MDHPLMTPLRFRNGRSSPNRVWVAPMTNKSSHADGHLSADELRFLEMRAAGGFGVVETCASHVSLDGQGWAGEFGMFDEGIAGDWARLAEAVRRHGSVLIGQAFHAGAKALRGADRPMPWSCSGSGEGEARVAEGSEAQIEGAIEAFAQAARRLESAGVDGIELHGAHGYLLSQFLSAVLNRREDGWGGSLEGRARLIRTVMQGVRAVVSDSFIVGVRLSPESSPNLPGLDLDESVRVARWLCDDGADFVHLSLWEAARNTQKRPNEHAARVFRGALPEAVPIITAGNLWTAEDGMAQLAHGADGVALGRAAIANPAWPREVAALGGSVRRPPLSAAQLRERGLGEAFVDYMRNWKGFVEG